MAAARHWRIIGVETYAGGDLELSSLQWYDSYGRVDGDAVVSCSHAPTMGSLSALQDENLSTVCKFAAGDIRTSGFWIQWDMGSPQELSSLRVAAPTLNVGLLRFVLQQSSDMVNWQESTHVGDISATAEGALSGVIAWRRFPAQMNPDEAFSGTTVLEDGVTGNYSGVLVRGYVAGGPVSQFEVTDVSHPYVVIGVSTSESPWYEFGSTHPKNWSIWCADGTVKNAATGPSTGAIAASSVVGIVVREGTLEFYVDGVLRNAQYTGVPSGAKPSISIVGVQTFWSASVNLGAQPFLYPIAGALPWAGAESGLQRAIVATGKVNAPIVAASLPLPAHGAPLAPRLQVARDAEHGGTGTIYGTTKTKGTPNTPTKARVVLLAQRGKTLVRETWSDPATGAFEFRGIDTAQQFLTMAEDADGNFRPVAASMLVPEVLP